MYVIFENFRKNCFKFRHIKFINKNEKETKIVLRALVLNYIQIRISSPFQKMKGYISINNLKNAQHI